MNKSMMKAQSGAVLIISLIMLFALTMIGVTSSNVTGLEEKMAANNKNMNLAFQAAEATLRYVEQTQLTTAPLFPYSTSDMDQVDSTKTNNGLYTVLKNCNSSVASENQRVDGDSLTNLTKRPFYEKTNWNSANKVRTYDLGSGSSKKLSGIITNPTYIIEQLSCEAVTSSSATSYKANTVQTTPLASSMVLRITAHGWGNTRDALAVLQSTIKITYKN